VASSLETAQGGNLLEDHIDPEGWVILVAGTAISAWVSRRGKQLVSTVAIEVTRFTYHSATRTTVFVRKQEPPHAMDTGGNTNDVKDEISKDLTG
jgi:hypothetical protein